MEDCSSGTFLRPLLGPSPDRRFILSLPERVAQLSLPCGPLSHPRPGLAGEREEMTKRRPGKGREEDPHRSAEEWAVR